MESKIEPIQRRKRKEKLKQEPQEEKKKSNKGRKKQFIHSCPHKDAKHYAKGMCNHCYHMFGRNNAGLATKCEHTDKRNYCKGLCLNCYINFYNRTTKSVKKDQWAGHASLNGPAAGAISYWESNPFHLLIYVIIEVSGL